MKRQIINFYGNLCPVMAWKSENVDGRYQVEITFPEIRAVITFAAALGRIMPAEIQKVGEDGYCTIKPGRRVWMDYITIDSLPPLESMNHRDKLRHESPSVDVAAIIEQAVERVAPQCIEDQMRAAVAAINRTRNLTDLERQVCLLHFDGKSLTKIAASVHAAGLTKKRYTKEGIAKILDRVADKEKSLRPAIKGKASKRAAARMDAEEKQAQEHDNFFDEVDE